MHKNCYSSKITNIIIFIANYARGVGGGVCRVQSEGAYFVNAGVGDRRTTPPDGDRVP